MQVIFYKYRSNDGLDLKNYFDTNSNLELADKLTLYSLPADGFPVFNDEAEAADNFFQVKASDFDINISLLQNELSVNRKTVKEFFEDSKDMKILCIFEIGGIYRAGFVDMSMEFDLTVTQNKYNLRLTVYGTLKELKAHLLTLWQGDVEIPYEPFFITDYFNTLTSGISNLWVIDELDIPSRLGWNPKLSKPLYDDLKAQNYGINYNRWITFYSMALEFGFVFRVEPNIGSIYTDFPSFNLRMLWRRGNSNSEAIMPKIIEYKKGFQLPSQNKWVVIRNYEWVHHEGPPESGVTYTLAEGIRFSANESFKVNKDENGSFQNYICPKIDASGMVHNPRIYDETYLLTKYFVQFGNYSFKSEEVTINLDGRFISRLEQKASEQPVLSFSRIFVHDYGVEHIGPPIGGYDVYWDYGNPDILYLCAYAEYGFLINNTKKTIKLTIVYPDQNLRLFSIIQTEGVNYFVCRIKNIKLLDKIADVEAIEC